MQRQAALAVALFRLFAYLAATDFVFIDILTAFKACMTNSHPATSQPLTKTATQEELRVEFLKKCLIS